MIALAYLSEDFAKWVLRCWIEAAERHSGMFLARGCCCCCVF